MAGRGDYEIGVSSGWWGIAKAPELLGLAAKAASITTYGVNYVQVDFENTSEFFEPDVIERLRQVIDDLQIKWGAHGEIGEFMAWESAIEVIWKQSHRRLHQYLDGLYDFFLKGKGQRSGRDYSKYKPEYINFHASNAPPIGLFVERFRYGGHVMLEIEGNENWDELMKKPENAELKKWFQENILFHVYARGAGIAFMDENEIIVNAIRRMAAKKFAQSGQEEIDETKEDFKKYFNELVEGWKNDDSTTKKKIYDFIYDSWLELTALRNLRGAIELEEWAYAVIAKYLEFAKDRPDEPIWNLFFKGKSMEDLEAEWKTPEREVKLFDKFRGFVNLMPDIVAAVALRYIIGHFKKAPLPEFIQEKKIEFKRKNLEWDTFYELPAIKKLEKIKVYFTFETPEIIENQREGLQRIIRARHIYMMVKAFEKTFGTEYIKGWFDSEHYIHNGFDPIEEIGSCPDNMGEYFIGFHVGAPKPYHPVHEPIDVGSEAQRWIYIYAYNLRKKGFGLKDKGIIIFERGGARGGQAPINFIAQSGTALRLIVEELKKDTPPDKLPLSFFGVSPEGFASPEKQLAMVREHYWDPLKGMLSVPEEEYTFFSKAALDKGKKPEEFKKEELR